MTDTGFIVPRSSSNTGAGHTGTNPTITLSGSAANVGSSDNTYDTIAHGSGSNTSDYVHYTNFDTSAIPSGATINGVELIMERKGSAANRGSDEVIQLVIGGSHGGTNKAVATKYPTTDTDSATYGGAADLWGNTITYTDVVTNTTTFGVAVKTTNNAAGSVTCSFDYIRIRITYTASSGDDSGLPTGVAGTGAVGTFTVTGDANITPTGVAGTGAVGSPTVTLQLDVPVTGVAATGAAGTPTVTADANVTPTGVAAAGTAGDFAVTIDVTVTLDGVVGAGAVGTVNVDTSSALDDVAFPSGVAATGAAGDFTVTGDASVPVTGVAAAGAVGNITASGDAIVTLTGVAAAGAVGNPTATGDAIVSVTGVAGTGSVGTPTATGDAVATITGVQGTGAAGDTTVNITGSVDVFLDGVAAVGSAGDITATGESSIVVGTDGGQPQGGKPFSVFARPQHIHHYDPTFELHQQEKENIRAALDALARKDGVGEQRLAARIRAREVASTSALVSNGLILQAFAEIMRLQAIENEAQHKAFLLREDEAFLTMMAA